MYQYRTSMGAYGSTFFGKRACLHCFLIGDTIVLDSEWHWVFDCGLFDELRMKFPLLNKTFQSIQNMRGYSEEKDIGVLFEAIRNDSRLGLSLASFVRQATSLREKWLREVCVRGRLCPPPEHWHRNLLLCPPCGAELPQDFQQSFTDGKPWFFDPACLPPSHA